MLDLKPEKTQDPKNPGVIEENWWVTSQKMMGDRRFLQRLLDYDMYAIPEKILSRVRTQFIPDPEYQPSRVAKASVAAKGLCAWVHAVDKFERVNKVIAPKQLKAKEAQAKYNDCMLGLQVKQAALRDVMEQFEQL